MLRPVLGTRFLFTPTTGNPPDSLLSPPAAGAQLCLPQTPLRVGGFRTVIRRRARTLAGFQFLHMPGVIRPGIAHSGDSNPQHPQRSAPSKTNAFSPVDHSGVTKGVRCPSTRDRIRTDNLLDLNQTPLPIGLHGYKRPIPAGGCRIGLSAHERSRTSNNSDLNAAPLPLGYVCIRTPGRIRTDAVQDLNLAPLPLGYRSTTPPAIWRGLSLISRY